MCVCAYVCVCVRMCVCVCVRVCVRAKEDELSKKLSLAEFTMKIVAHANQ